MLDKIRGVEKVFKQLDKATKKFENQSGLKCFTGCTRCCFKKGLEANVLEFLPYAYYLVQNNLHEKALDLLEKNPEYCINLNGKPSEGSSTACTAYEHRGLICRLFGYSANKDKTGKLSVYTCSYIKEAQKTELIITNLKINNGMSIPLVTDYYYRIYFIDSILANDYNPINVSIQKAIEKVAYYYSNKPIRKKLMKVTTDGQIE